MGGQSPQGPSGGDGLVQHLADRVGVEGRVGGGHALDDQTPSVFIDDLIAGAVPAPFAARPSFPIRAGDTTVLAAGSADGAVGDGQAVRTQLCRAG